MNTYQGPDSKVIGSIESTIIMEACPFCRSQKIGVVQRTGVLGGAMQAAAICETCGARGPLFVFAEKLTLPPDAARKAMEMWNQRGEHQCAHQFEAVPDGRGRCFPMKAVCRFCGMTPTGLYGQHTQAQQHGQSQRCPVEPTHVETHEHPYGRRSSDVDTGRAVSSVTTSDQAKHEALNPRPATEWPDDADGEPA